MDLVLRDGVPVEVTAALDLARLPVEFDLAGRIITSSIASPMPSPTSMPDSAIPHSVASLTASSKGSYLSLNAG